MFHFIRDSDVSSEKSASNSRRSSTPGDSIATSLVRRAPLAPLDPQTANSAAPDDQMPSSASSSSFLAYPRPDAPQDSDRYNIGRPIIPNRAAAEDSGGNLQTSRRRSIPNQCVAIHKSFCEQIVGTNSSPVPHSLQNSSNVARLPSQQRPLPRRSNHTPSSSLSAARRPSLPSIHLHQPAPTFVTTSTTDSTTHLGATDDIYSNLSSFTFGAAHTNASPRRPELISPYSAAPGTASADRTPRPSVSGPSSKLRTPRMQTRNIDEDGDKADDEDEEEAARQTRAKMRAIDDGTRRPSLPINTQLPRKSSAGSSRDSDSERELDSSGSYGEGDAEDMDTDHTFGGGDRYEFSASGVADDQMSVTIEGPFCDDEYEEEEDHLTSMQGELSASQSRHGSVPWHIPGPSASGPSREREDSAATVKAVPRMSRSLDDGLGHGAEDGTVQASSQPQSKSDFHNLLLQTDQANAGDGAHTNANVYDGFDLGYVLGSGMRSSEEGVRRSWSSGTPSYVAIGMIQATDARQMATEYGWNIPAVGERRPSTITVTTTSGEDAFTRQLRDLDRNYEMRRMDWSFRKETADGVGPTVTVTTLSPSGTSSTRVGMQEIWRHPHVGRFKVDKLLMRPENPSKSAQQRVNVRHIADPYSKGNIRGGPTSVIHKHSRAMAFSIFRRHGLFNRAAQRGGNLHMHSSGSILLATMRVQEQFTSTRTTSQLNAHGLLSDGTVDRAASSRSDVGPSRHRRERSKEDKDKAKKAKEDKMKGSSRKVNATTSVGSVSSRTTDDEVSPKGKSKLYTSPSSPSLPSFPTSPTLAEAPLSKTHGRSPASSLDHVTSLNATEVSEHAVTKLPTPERVTLNDEDAMDLDDEEQTVPRTSHAEAFATLDSNSIEYIRGRSEQRSDYDSSSHGVSFSEVVRRIFGRDGRVISRPPAGPPSAAIDGGFTPPWVTMAPRSKQEERSGTNRNDRGKGKRPMKNTMILNVFVNVPADALHMLLPLWPGETDPPSVVEGEDPSTYFLPVEERQYLIVYYVPFDERKEKGKKKQELNKKRSRNETQSAPTVSSNPKAKSITLTSFRVCARLVSYHDFTARACALPSDGLSVTGPVSEAMAQLPPASIREQHLDDLVIGVCQSRQNGMEFIPEGLAKLGLCMPVQSQNGLLLCAKRKTTSLKSIGVSRRLGGRQWRWRG
ncbi:hypothetical protein A0H81_12824 [Grifola frondosa]|uniref:Uncharacterized protein n=1 Tax=Grifola frondosa TaxID=5627 RepID=A0A1C7LQY3_GRIFR|nr:hypothetical protein A0H81_12824 [Grifola frondosa]